MGGERGNQGSQPRGIPRDCQERGITDGHLTGRYKGPGENAPVRIKGIWELAQCVADCVDEQCPWFRLFAYYDLHPGIGDGGLGRPSNTWRRPSGGVQAIAQFSRWPGRNAAAERLVRLAIQHREE